MQADPARSIPSQVLAEARGLLIVRETKGGLILGARSGQAMASVRRDGTWSAPAFFRVREGSLGLQAGWQQATFFHVLMTEAAVSTLHSNRFQLGLGLRVTSGPRTVGDGIGTADALGDVLVYADTSGVFGGVAVEGGSLSPDEKLNEAWYGLPATEVLAGRAAATDPEVRRWVELVEKCARTEPARDPSDAR